MVCFRCHQSTNFSIQTCNSHHVESYPESKLVSAAVTPVSCRDTPLMFPAGVQCISLLGSAIHDENHIRVLEKLSAIQLVNS